MKKFCALLTALILLVFCGESFADHEEQYVRTEAERRGVKLLSIEKAKEIAAERIGSGNIRFKDADLEEESDDYPNAQGFRPVYSFECISGSKEYDIEIDAVTGEVLKFKLDD